VRVVARVGGASSGAVHAVSGVNNIDIPANNDAHNDSAIDDIDCNQHNDGSADDNVDDDADEHEHDGASDDDGASVLLESDESMQSDELGGELRSERAVLLLARGPAGVADAGDCNHVLVVGRTAADADVRGDGLLVGVRGQSSVGAGAGTEQRGSVGSGVVREQ
jgi:hypothetical protein